MLLILIMLLSEKPDFAKPIKKAVPIYSVAVICISLYFGLASALYYAGSFEAAAKLYSGYTNAWEQILLQAQDAETMNAVADKILSHNKTHSLANSAKARVAYSQGDFGKMIEYKEKAISSARYSLDEYIDYASMLQVGLQLYSQSGDIGSAEICKDKLLKIPDMIAEVEKGTSSIAWKLDEKPQLTLPDELLEYLEQIS